MTTPAGQDSPRVLAIASGKGGSGKSLLAANVGIFLATLGKRVVLVDAAFGSPNLHTYVGVRHPERSLSDMLQNKGVPLDQVIVATSIPGLGLVSAQRDPAWSSNPKSAQLTRLRTQIRKMEADYIIVDLGSGTRGAVLDLWLSADVRTLVLRPEPTAVELGYRFLRAAFERRLSKISLADRTAVPEDEIRDFAGGIPAPADFLRRAQAAGDAELVEILRREMRDLRPTLLLNFVRSKSDLDLGENVQSAVRRQLGLPLRYLGALEYDDAVWVALRRGKPLLIEHPEARVSKCIEKVTRRLLGKGRDHVEDVELVDNHYDLFEVEPTASGEEIRRANRRMREVYGRDSIVVTGLYTRKQLDELHRKLDEAYDTLMDPPRRKAYDAELFPDGLPTGSARAHNGGVEPEAVVERPRPKNLPPMPEISDDTDYTGELMQQVRQAHGLGLREISERTKIGMSYLAAIESESWGKLPAVVYVRGFLVEYARMLQLDVPRVLDTYLERYREVRAALDHG